MFKRKGVWCYSPFVAGKQSSFREVVKDALAELVEAGWLRPVEHRPPKGQGGKTKVEYLINPKVKKLRTPRA